MKSKWPRKQCSSLLDCSDYIAFLFIMGVVVIIRTHTLHNSFTPCSIHQLESGIWKTWNAITSGTSRKSLLLQCMCQYNILPFAHSRKHDPLKRNHSLDPHSCLGTYMYLSSAFIPTEGEGESVLLMADGRGRGHRSKSVSLLVVIGNGGKFGFLSLPMITGTEERGLLDKDSIWPGCTSVQAYTWMAICTAPKQ